MPSINICFIGDIMLGRYSDISSDSGDSISTFNDKLSKGSLDSIYGDTLPYLKSCDLLVGNLETAITSRTDREHKVFNFRVDPIYSYALKLNSNMYLSIANNHILDYKVEGMKDTIKHLDKLSIKHGGAGMNRDEAIKMTIFTIGDQNGDNIKVGIFSCADHYSRWASNSSPGIHYLDYEDYSDIIKLAKDYKTEVDLLILSVHWGGNYARGVEDKIRRFSMDIVEAGVDILHGHSSHHVKCIKYSDSKVIIYGNGDFINDYAIDRDYHSNLGMVVVVRVKFTKNSLPKLVTSIRPTIIEDRMVRFDKDIAKVVQLVCSDCRVNKSNNHNNNCIII